MHVITVMLILTSHHLTMVLSDSRNLEVGNEVAG